MTKGKSLAEQLLGQIVGLVPTRVKLGHGSFVTLDFGRDIPSQINTRNGLKTVYHGEWHIWIYMCAWRLDKDGVPVVGSNDLREQIAENLNALENKTLEGIFILNDAFDIDFQFSHGLRLYLFSYNATSDEQWKFFTPEEKVFIAGPSSSWRYIHVREQPS